MLTVFTTLQDYSYVTSHFKAADYWKARVLIFASLWHSVL